MELPRYESGEANAEPLGQPLQFPNSGLTAKNRLMKSPMAETLATWSNDNVEQRGIPTPEIVELYRRWGQGEKNWGVIVTGNIDVDWSMPNGPGDMIVTPECPPEGERFEKFSEVASAAKAHGSLVVAQLTHPGRQIKDSLSSTAVSASDIQLGPSNGMTFPKPHAASKEEIKDLVNRFAYAAEYLEKAGFNGVELHSAHGYLISQFLSRTTNHRTDEYGVQNVENRMRFIADIVSAIKSKVSSKFIVAAKLNSVEFQEGGVTPEEAREVCEGLEKMGLDYVSLSGGTYENFGMEWEKESTKIREGFFLKFAKAITEAMGPNRKMKIYLVGGLRSVGALVNALSIVDGFAFGRPAAAEPRLASDILNGRVKGAFRPTPVAEENFLISMVAAGAQIYQIARGYEPFRTGDEAAIGQLQQDMGAYFQKIMAEGANLKTTKPLVYSGPQVPYSEG